MAFPPPRDETLHGTRSIRVRNRGILDVPPYDVAVIQPHIGRYSVYGIDKLPPGPTFSLFLPFRNRPRLTLRGRGVMIGTRLEPVGPGARIVLNILFDFYFVEERKESLGVKLEGIMRGMLNNWK